MDRADNNFFGWAFHEVVKEESTPPPPTAEEWAAMPSTPSDVGDGLEYREWCWENRPPNAGGRPRLPESSSSAEVSAEKESEDEEDNEDEAEYEDIGDGVEDEAWHAVSEAVSTPSASRATSPAPTKRDATHFSPQKGAAPKKRKGTPRTKPLDTKREAELTSTILKLPPNLPAIRQAVFSLHAGQKVITWTAAEWKQIWPFVDNIWIRNQVRPMTEKNTQACYYWCRLYHGSYESTSTGQRAKQMRTWPPCGMKLKVINRFNSADTSQLETVSLSLHTEKKKPCFVHNHDLDFSDTIKINSFIMDAVGQQVALGYEPAHIHRVLVGVKWTGNLTALKAAGGTHFDLKDVHNAGAEWRRAHPDLRHQGAKIPWEQQRQELLDALKSCEDILSSNLEAVRHHDKETTYATAFASKSKSKWWCKW